MFDGRRGENDTSKSLRVNPSYIITVQFFLRIKKNNILNTSKTVFFVNPTTCKCDDEHFYTDTIFLKYTEYLDFYSDGNFLNQKYMRRIHVHNCITIIVVWGNFYFSYLVQFLLILKKKKSLNCNIVRIMPKYNEKTFCFFYK